MYKFLKLIIYLILFFIISGFFGNYFFLFDLFSHFYLQFFVVSLLFLMFYIYKKYKIEVIISVLVILFLFFSISGVSLSGIWGGETAKNPDIFYINANYWNMNISEIFDYINKINPKEIIIVELNKNLFEKIKNSYKFKTNFYYPDGDKSFGFFTNEDVLDKKIYIAEEYPIGYFKFKNITYYIIHPLPPFDNEAYQKQKKFFGYVSNFLKNEKNKFLLIGDFNSTVYSQVFKSNFGDYFYKPIYSWKVDSLFTLPIDYAISDKNIDIYPGEKLSSDHIPLLIDLGMLK